MEGNNKEKINRDFSIRTVNNIIRKMSKSGVLIVVVIYIIIMALILSLIGRKEETYIEPPYNHVAYNDVISPSISMFASRRYNTEGVESLSYNFTIQVHGRYVDGKDPQYKISNFRVSASVSESLTAVSDKIYRFTEYTNYSTPVSHSYNLDSSAVKQHPRKLFLRIQYTRNRNVEVASFMEEVMLLPTSTDKDHMNLVYSSQESNNQIMAITGKADSHPGETGNLQFKAVKVLDEKDQFKGNYKFTVQVQINNKTSTPYHYDMQSWIITDKDEYLPFMGVYNYTSPSFTYSQPNRELDYRTKGKYICAKLTYQSKDGSYVKSFYYQQDIAAIQSEFQLNPDISEILDDELISNPDNKLWIVAAVIVGSMIIGCTIVYTVVIINKKIKLEKKVE